MKRAAAAMAALAALAGGCVAPPESGPRSRNLKYGLFYEAFRPESSRQAEIKTKLDRPAAPEIDETFDVSKIRATRTFSETQGTHTLRDWDEGVLLRADVQLLRAMRQETAAKVERLEARLATLKREPEPLQTGRIEPVRESLDIEKLKLDRIDDRLARMESSSGLRR